MILIPEIRGTVAIRSAPAEFLDTFRRRVASGLLSGSPHPRSNYVVAEAGHDRLLVRAADWWTALNVGLNELELQVPAPGSVRYRVRYWRWAGYALGLCGALGLIGLLLLLALDVRAYIARSPDSMVPGLSVEQHLLIAWLMVLFWGFLWPWVLVMLHKSPLRRLMARLIAEVDAVGGGVASR